MLIYGGLPAASYPISQYIPRGVLRREQMESVYVIERAAQDEEVPPEVAMAMVANAYMESKLDPNAVAQITPWTGVYHQPLLGGEDSVGLFMLNIVGAGRGMSVDLRKDPEENTERIIEELFATRHGATRARSLPPYEHEHPLDAHERGVRDVGHLTAMFQFYVEKPNYHAEWDTKRRSWGSRIFPGFVQDAVAQRPGAALPSATSSAAASTRTRRAPRTQKAGTWSTADSNVRLINRKGKRMPQGIIPAGSYEIVWHGIPTSNMVRIETGKRYLAVSEGRTVRFTEV